MKTIKNYEELVKKVKTMMQDYAYDCPSCEIDIYAYYDADTQTADIMDYAYVGNSWIDDDHICLHTIHQGMTEWDIVDDPETELPEILNMDMDAIVQTVADATGWDADNITTSDIRDYIMDTEDWYQKLQDWRKEIIYEVYDCEFQTAAEEAVAEHFEKEEED